MLKTARNLIAHIKSFFFTLNAEEKEIERLITKAAISVGYHSVKVTNVFKRGCPFCDYPNWYITVTERTEWSDNTITYKHFKLNVHNFIEVDDIIKLPKNTDMMDFRRLNNLQSKLIENLKDI